MASRSSRAKVSTVFYDSSPSSSLRSQTRSKITAQMCALAPFTAFQSFHRGTRFCTQTNPATPHPDHKAPLGVCLGNREPSFPTAHKRHKLTICVTSQQNPSAACPPEKSQYADLSAFFTAHWQMAQSLLKLIRGRCECLPVPAPWRTTKSITHRRGISK